MDRVVRDIRLIPVKVFVDEEFLCPAQVRVLIDEDGGVQEQLVVAHGVDLSGVTPAQVACQILKPLDAFAYFGAVMPEMIGRDE
jgi:hypothetical protein